MWEFSGFKVPDLHDSDDWLLQKNQGNHINRFEIIVIFLLLGLHFYVTTIHESFHQEAIRAADGTSR